MFPYATYLKINKKNYSFLTKTLVILNKML